MNETRRLYRTLDKHFQESQSKYLVGDKCTIADIAISSWAKILGRSSFHDFKSPLIANNLAQLAFAGVDMSEFPYVAGWQARMEQRPAVQKGSNTPKKVDLEKLAKDPVAFNTYLKTNESWIKHGMVEDSKK